MFFNGASMYRRSTPQAIEKCFRIKKVCVFYNCFLLRNIYNMNRSSGMFPNMDVTDACFLYLIDVLQA